MFEIVKKKCKISLPAQNKVSGERYRTVGHLFFFFFVVFFFFFVVVVVVLFLFCFFQNIDFIIIIMYLHFLFLSKIALVLIRLIV